MRCSIFSALLGGVLVLGLGACNTNGCMENRNSVPLAGFYSYGTKQAITVDSLQITGDGMPADDPLLAVTSRVNHIYLPMRSTQQSTSWVFAYKQKALDYPELNDTITFDYESTPYFASNDCGVIFKYSITRMAYTKHLIDSVAITDSIITNVDIERIQIYFRTAEPEQ